MKKIIITLLLGSSLGSSAIAAEPLKVTLGGKIDTQVGVVDQEKAFGHIDSDVSKGKLHKFALVNNTRIKVKAESKASNGIKYGANIELYADASANADGTASPIGDKVWSFIETKYGRMEAGSVKGATNQMHIYGAVVAKGPGGIDGDYADWIAKKTIDGKSHGERFTLTPGLPTFCDCKSGANKVVYFTPKFKGLQLGASYMPDVQIFGTTSRFQNTSRATGAEFEHIYEGVVKYEGKVSEYTYAVSLSGEKGNAKSGNLDRENLQAWEVGTQAGYKNFNIAASYSDWGTSGAPVVKNPNAKYGGSHWTLGASYDFGRFGTSVTYMNSRKANLFSGSAPALLADHDLSHNKLELISLGAEYKMAEGLMQYAEVTFFDFDRNAVANNNKGKVFLFGSKLSF